MEILSMISFIAFHLGAKLGEEYLKSTNQDGKMLHFSEEMPIGKWAF